MKHQEYQYLDLMSRILKYGHDKETERTKTGTWNLFTEVLRFDLSDSFPLLTTKTVFYKKVFAELIWFLKGDTNVAFLEEHDVKFWTPFADDSGSIGPMYGTQWMKCDGQVNQIQRLIDSIERYPNSRRHIVCSWNPKLIPQDEDREPKLNVKEGLMSIAPCHCLFQFYCHDHYLSCTLYQRSADIFLGVPFNIASYAALTHLVALKTGRKPAIFNWVGGDCHIYKNHVTQVKQQLQRIPYPFPKLHINKANANIDLTDLRVEDFIVTNYTCHHYISAPLNV